MMKKIVALAAALFAVASWAAVDVNKASDAELDSVKGVGPALSKRILDARKEAPFKDWPDFMSRVKGGRPGPSRGEGSQGRAEEGGCRHREGLGKTLSPRAAASPR